MMMLKVIIFIPLSYSVVINDFTLYMILDTGSKVTLIDFDTYKANISDCKLYPSDTNLSTFDKILIDIIIP